MSETTYEWMKASTGRERMQAAFDHVCRHLRAQGRRSEVHGTCVNKTDDGRRCALACLVPNPEPFMPEVKNRLRKRGLPYKFLHYLREAHDSACDNKFRVRLREVGIRYGLDVSLTEKGAL